jgi:hypothetical protein
VSEDRIYEVTRECPARKGGVTLLTFTLVVLYLLNEFGDAAEGVANLLPVDVAQVEIGGHSC